MSNQSDKNLNLDELVKPEQPSPEAEIDVTPAGSGQEAPGRSDRSLTRRDAGGEFDNLGAISDIPVQLSAVLGKANMPVNQLLRLGRGAVVELDRKVGEPIDILVNNRLVARGEVVVVDERLGVTMTEIIKSEA